MSDADVDPGPALPDRTGPADTSVQNGGWRWAPRAVRALSGLVHLVALGRRPLAQDGRAVGQTAVVLTPELRNAAARAGDGLRARGQTVGVAEGSCGGLISAALLAQPGASAYYAGGVVIYTLAASRAFLTGAVTPPAGLRGASEPFARYLAEAVRVRLDATWGIGEGGAAGPTGNRYGDPAGHAWVGVAGPGTGPAATRHVLTGDDDRERNMLAFALAALELLATALDGA